MRHWGSGPWRSRSASRNSPTTPPPTGVWWCLHLSHQGTLHAPHPSRSQPLTLLHRLLPPACSLHQVTTDNLLGCLLFTSQPCQPTIPLPFPVRDAGQAPDPTLSSSAPSYLTTHRPARGRLQGPLQPRPARTLTYGRPAFPPDRKPPPLPSKTLSKLRKNQHFAGVTGLTFCHHPSVLTPFSRETDMDPAWPPMRSPPPRQTPRPIVRPIQEPAS